MTVAALQRLPGSSARTFAIAFALGQWMDADGSSARLSSGKAAAGSLIDDKRLPDVLEEIGITARTWREYVTEWESNYIGHRCQRGRVFLFSRPFLSSCPACGTRIYIDHAEKPAHLPRGPGLGMSPIGDTSAKSDNRLSDSNGVNSATPTASSAPFRGTNSAVQDWPIGTNSAVPEHDPATPGSGGFNGKEGGSHSPQVFEEAPSQEGFSESARLALDAIAQHRAAGLSDSDVAGLLNGRPDAFPPPRGFARWTGYGVRVATGEATHAA